MRDAVSTVRYLESERERERECVCVREHERRKERLLNLGTMFKAFKGQKAPHSTPLQWTRLKAPFQ